MADKVVVGIDGGGSTIRVIVAEPDLTIIGQAEDTSTVNPNVRGHDAALGIVQEKMREAIAAAQLSPEQIDAVGIGIAGAEAGHSGEWLRTIIAGVCPNAKMALSSDHEIALVGALGERRGVLILSGTGSIAYGVNSVGKTSLIGGWGYLLGDEGSGYWIGMSGLKAAVRAAEGRGTATSLVDALMTANNLTTRGQIVRWVYGEPRTRDIARFAPVVMEQAAAGDRVSQQIIECGAMELELKVRTILQHLNREPLPIAFTGSLLTQPNMLSMMLCDLLGLTEFPQAKYSAVIGAALMALNLI